MKKENPINNDQNKALVNPQYHQKIRNDDEISRRHFMQKMVTLFGATTATAVISGCGVPVAKKIADDAQKGSGEKQAGNGFSEQQMTVLYSLCETILPKTNTPSAVEAGCHTFVQHQLQHCHSIQQQDDCVHIVDKIDQLAMQSFNKNFALLSNSEQKLLLENIENNQGLENGELGQFIFLKALIVYGYFTSEAGATLALNYQPIPGGFVGSVPANSETKSWGSLDYY